MVFISFRLLDRTNELITLSVISVMQSFTEAIHYLVIVMMNVSSYSLKLKYQIHWDREGGSIN